MGSRFELRQWYITQELKPILAHKQMLPCKLQMHIIYHIFFYGISNRRRGFSSTVMFNLSNTKDTILLKNPLTQSNGQLLVSSFRVPNIMWCTISIFKELPYNKQFTCTSASLGCFHFEMLSNKKNINTFWITSKSSYYNIKSLNTNWSWPLQIFILI